MKADYQAIRRQYGEKRISTDSLDASPFSQLKFWLNEALAMDEIDANAMTLATVDQHGNPDCRVVLLKEIRTEGLVFYSNYQSEKGQHIDRNPEVAVSFYWPQSVRQVRLRGCCQKISAEESDAYFSSRPILSQAAAALSQQSQILPSVEKFEQAVEQLAADNKLIGRPNYWGGYLVVPNKFEFFQGRNNRLNNRILYQLVNNSWQTSQFYP